nr:hypothetical protein [Oscillochloris trichoides]
MISIKNTLKNGLHVLQQPKWHRLVLACLITLSLLIAAWVVIRDWSNLKNYGWQFNWLHLMMSSLSYTLALFLAIFSWISIMYALNVRISWKIHVQYYIYSWMARRLPTAVPFVASRVMLYEKVGLARRLTLTGMLWEQILQVVSGGILIILMFPFTSIVNGNIPLIPVIITTLIGIILITQPSLITKGVNYVLIRWGKEPIRYSLSRNAILSVFFLYVLLWLMGGFILFFMIHSLYSLEWSILPVVIQIWTFTGLVGFFSFLVPVSLGLSDISMTALLTLIMPLSVALIVVVLIRVWITAHEFFWALVFSRYKRG